MDTLIREGNPPAGQLASPVPQVWDPTANGGQGAWVRVHGTNNAQHVTLTGSTAEIGHTGAIERRVVLFNAVEIRDTGDHTRNLIQHAGLSESEIRRFREFRISFVHNHDAQARVRIYTPARAFNATSTVAGGLLFDVAGFIPSGNASRLIIASPGGQGAGPALGVVPALRGLHTNIIVQVTYESAPTAGSLTVHVEMHS